ncbi:DUF397 domain-containing protein [Streptomyces sp. NPDC005900]|uniref:DUF397 domain-containing protein n=1 Tax=unclassified Streptomyces TaxID=2593676 RepID=UPI0033C705C8
MNEKPNWHTSSYTKSDTCVEVADNDPTEIKVRDSKNKEGAVLAFPPTSWMSFVEFSTTFDV